MMAKVALAAAPIKSSAPRTRPSGGFLTASNGKRVELSKYPYLWESVNIAGHAVEPTRSRHIEYVRAEAERIGRLL